MVLESRTLTPKEISIMQANCRWFDQQFAFRKKKCGNPDCNFPLSGLIENNFSISLSAPICELCHAMETAIRGKKGLEAAHEEWRDYQRLVKKILEQNGSKYL